MRGDDGDINYDKGDLTQAVAKVTQDLTLNWGDFGFYGRWLYFYDFVNNDFDETHRNIITPENVDRVGVTGDPISNRYFQHVYGPGAREKLKRNDGSTLRSIGRSEEHTSELQSLMRLSYAVCCLNTNTYTTDRY